MRSCEFGGPTDLEVLKLLLTAERLSSYDSGRGEDLVRIVHLYESNMHAAAAVIHTMGMIEVLVRNALDIALTQWWE